MPDLDGCIVGVLGAGAMGSGIAQIAASRGHRVVLADASAAALGRTRDGLARTIAREVERSRMDSATAAAVLERIAYAELSGEEGMAVFADCGVVIEAIVEDLAVKQESFARLETAVAPDLRRSSSKVGPYARR